MRGICLDIKDGIKESAFCRNRHQDMEMIGRASNGEDLYMEVFGDSKM
jgi:hypothetical protein